MGTILSSTKDYNRTLAKQPPKSFVLAKFEVPNIQQQPLVGTLSIPDPVRFSQKNTNRFPDSVNVPRRSEFQPRTNEPFRPPKLPPIIENPREQKATTTIQSPSHSSRPTIPAHTQTMNNDPLIVRRSIVNFNKHRRLNNNQLTSYPGSQSVVERNGKQFLTELHERMERRYVQTFDETTGQIRLFEVTDYIPTRIVRSVQNSPQLPLQNGTAHNSFSMRSSFNQRPTSQNTLNERIQPATPSNLVDFKDLNNRETVARQFDLYHSGVGLPLNNNTTAPTTNPPQTQLTAQDSMDSTYSQPKPYYPPTTASQDVNKQYPPSSYRSQAASFRPHSPTASDYSVATSATRSTSENSDVESINRTLTPTNQRNKHNRNNTGVAHGTFGGRNSPAEPDPFARTIPAGDHTYSKRPGFNNYSEPTAHNQGFGRTGVSDYTVLPMPRNQSNRNRRKESNAYDG